MQRLINYFDLYTDGVDYTGVSAFLPFGAGSNPNLQQTFTIPITNDNFCEDQETILLQLSASSPGQFLTGQDQCSVVIIDDDGELVYAFVSLTILQIEICIYMFNYARAS